MLKKVLITAIILVLIWIEYRSVTTPPPRFPQFEEYPIAGPGLFSIPQWSADSRYLAYIERSRDPMLVVYDFQTHTSWNVAFNISSMHFSWGPNNRLTYLKYQHDSNVSSGLMISELHQVDLTGQNDTVIANNLAEVGDYDWFYDGERIAILLAEPSQHSYYNDIFILNTSTHMTSSLLNAKDIGLQDIVSLALSPDERTMLIYGVHEENAQFEAQIVLYSLESNNVIERIIPSQVVPSGDMSYPPAGLLDSTNFGWITGQRWLLAAVNTPEGECYNYALFFFDTHDLKNNFCIPTVNGIIVDPTISPDMTKMSYVSVLGPGNNYLMIGQVSAELLNKLGTRPQ